MDLLNATSLSLSSALAIFSAGALAVWLAGTRLSRYVSGISDATGIGKAFLGMVLLGGITSLPELATSMTAASTGNAQLAVNNVLGGLSMQVAILGVADVALMRGALTSIIARPVVLLQGAFDVLLLLLVAAGIAVGETGALGVGAWVSAIMLISLASLWVIRQYGQRPSWRPDGSNGSNNGDPREAAGAGESVSSEGAREGGSAGEGPRSVPLRRLILLTTITGLVIFVAGYFVARSGEAIAEHTGLGSSFVGAVLVAISTSLPEVSTVFSAVRQRQHELAVSDIFGTNLFDIALLFVIDVAYTEGYALNEVGRFSLVAALLGGTITSIFIIGLIERRDRTFLRAGVDSWFVLATYLSGLVLLYSLR